MVIPQGKKNGTPGRIRLGGETKMVFRKFGNTPTSAENKKTKKRKKSPSEKVSGKRKTEVSEHS